MTMIDICKKNALLYTKLICKPTKESPFSKYFDWADHIATNDHAETDQPDDYLYHLNKTAVEIDNLVTIFRPHIRPNDFNSWEKKWHEPTLAAAWIHDIGMVDGREKHGQKSAEMLFNDDPRFDFTGIALKDKIKTGLLCIKHHTGWPGIFNSFKIILEKHSVPDGLDILKQLFTSTGAPCWQLDFSGKLILTADFLRYRGKNLRNDLKQPFFIWSECAECGAIYDSQRDSCSTSNCGSKLEPKIVVSHHFKHGPFDSETCPEISVYNEPDLKKASAIAAGSRGYVSARDDNQNNPIFTRGDMSLFDVTLIDTKTWLDGLIKKDIDYTSIISYIYDEKDEMTDQYKTVVRVSLDISNIDAAIFALEKYIADFMQENITAEDDAENLVFLNRSIIRIRVSDESLFSLRFKEISNERPLPETVKEAVGKIKKKFKEWDEKHNIVLPVEVSEKRLEVISL